MHLPRAWLWLHTLDCLHVGILIAIVLLVAGWATFQLDAMLWVQARRCLSLLRFYLTTLHRSRITLQEFQGSVATAYASHAFNRTLKPLEVLQLALRAGFPPAAAAALAHVPPAQAQRNPQGQASGSKGTAPTAPSSAWQERRGRCGANLAGIPAWKYRFFMWWFGSQLATLELVREEWEQLSPLLICGFDVTRAAAEALLFRRPKGTCLVRLGTEVGGIVVSLRSDSARLPAEQRTTESYFDSVTPAQLAGAAYQVAEQPWMPERRALREGAVIHVFVPSASLRLHGGLWGCLSRMRHTKLVLDVLAGQVLPSNKAFKQPPPRPTPRQLAVWRNKLLRQRQQQAPAAAP